MKPKQYPNDTDPESQSCRQIPDDIPIAYFITIRCYGTRLHGNPDGSVHHRKNIRGTPFVPEYPYLVRHQEKKLKNPPYHLDEPRRQIVLKAIKEVCKYRNWDLFAAHVRTNHFHVVVQALCRPEKAMNAFKSYSSRYLNKACIDPKGQKRWARHGSTVYLWEENQLEQAVNYVLREQGEALEIFEKT